MLRKTTVFTQEQINILRQKFAAGMINHYEISLIEEVASETGLTVEIIKNWITNEKAKHKPTAPRRPTTPRTRIQTTKRALSGYNVFMKEFFQKTKIDDYLKEHTDIIIEGLESL
ncbi:2853_t:CDS:2 [Paraglomus brasilianum]|uniref:2853_t:CDS:1 n=1 Tax=Paraglomus brasilianum TaxID=144538 RepID=A0A9N9EFY5_9GLOM|nr:2853_t:CDS:2 [Paraglomus brasilianum]